MGSCPRCSNRACPSPPPPRSSPPGATPAAARPTAPRATTGTSARRQAQHGVLPALFEPRLPKSPAAAQLAPRRRAARPPPPRSSPPAATPAAARPTAPRHHRDKCPAAGSAWGLARIVRTAPAQAPRRRESRPPPPPPPPPVRPHRATLHGVLPALFERCLSEPPHRRAARPRRHPRRRPSDRTAPRCMGSCPRCSSGACPSPPPPRSSPPATTPATPRPTVPRHHRDKCPAAGSAWGLVRVVRPGPAPPRQGEARRSPPARPPPVHAGSPRHVAQGLSAMPRQRRPGQRRKSGCDLGHLHSGRQIVS